jgi:dTDP-glucose 4,6-dehydratase
MSVLTTVVNFAAESHVDRSIEHPEVFLTTNILGTQTLMEACALIVSADFTRYRPTRYTAICRWTGRTCCLTKKPDPDLFALQRKQSRRRFIGALLLPHHGLPVTISRCSNNYGPYQFPEKLIPLTILNALDEKNIPYMATGSTEEIGFMWRIIAPRSI